MSRSDSLSYPDDYIDVTTNDPNALSGQGSQQTSGLETYSMPNETPWDSDSYEMFNISENGTHWGPHLYATKDGVKPINRTVYGVVVDDISTRTNALSDQGQQQASSSRLQTYATPVERLQAWDPASYEMFQLRKDGENETTWNSELYTIDHGVKPISRTVYGAPVDETIVDDITHIKPTEYDTVVAIETPTQN